MVYSNRFVISILVNGLPQRELANGTVQIPFGDYAVRLRNKNDRRAVAKIFIDGENVSGAGYVVPANDSVDIKRHHDKDRAFKFVALDSADAVDFGKNGPNPEKVKGTIEVRFFLEKEQPKPVKVDYHHHHHHTHSPLWYYGGPYHTPFRYTTCGGSLESMGNSTTDGGLESLGGTYNMCSSNDSPTLSYNASASNADITRSMEPRSRRITKSHGPDYLGKSASLSAASVQPVAQDGCTVEGNVTNQSFTTVHIEYESEPTVLKLFLQGFNQPVAMPNPYVPTPVFNPPASDLERQNEELRKQIAELENEKLRKKLAELQS